MASAGVDINGIPYDDAILNEGKLPPPFFGFLSAVGHFGNISTKDQGRHTNNNQRYPTTHLRRGTPGRVIGTPPAASTTAGRGFDIASR